jgi:hypothetical protein
MEMAGGPRRGSDSPDLMYLSGKAIHTFWTPRQGFQTGSRHATQWIPFGPLQTASWTVGRAIYAEPCSRSPRQNLISLKKHVLDIFLLDEALSVHSDSQDQGNRNYIAVWKIWVWTADQTLQH